MAAVAGNYKRILDLLEKWPIDKSKTGRDLGEYLKKHVEKAYKENKFETNYKYWDRQYLSMKRLADDEHLKKYSRNLSSSATGLTAEQCNIALSNEFLEELQKEDQPFLRKLFSLKSHKE